MAISRGKQYSRPVNIVEIRPSNIAPSSPPSSPKAVRFAPSRSGVVTGISRELTCVEAWSLYHFEDHARACSTCHDPLDVYLSGGQLCDYGHALAQDVAEHVYHRAGEIYSRKKDKHKHVRVELPPGYDQVRGLLKGMAHRIRQASGPVISYDRSYPVSPRPSPAEREPEYYEGRTEVTIEPADSRRHKGSGRKSRHKSSPYKTTVVQEYDSEPEPSSSREAKPRERRGSLYHSDRQRKEKDYHVETREPAWERRKKDERRKSGFFA